MYKTKQELEDAMDQIDPDASDEIIAGVVADYLMSRGARHFSIFQDVRRTAARRYKRFGFRPPSNVGPSPLPYDWAYKNIVGISARDRLRARQWIIDATLLGYEVFYSLTRQGAGFGQGSLAKIRKRRREEIQRNEIWRHREENQRQPQS
jgi:hypothetical protein